MKIAIVHDWFSSYAGSERVVEQILTLYPSADLYSLIDFLPDNERQGILKRARTSFIQKLPFARNKYRLYLPLMPFAVERFDLSDYDLILSSSHAVAKGARKGRVKLHICYCHTPMRYAWDLRDQYLREAGLDRGLKGRLARMVLEYIRRWDASTTDRVDYFIANSHFIADRIRRAYGRDSTVIYPPVDIDSFTFADRKEEFYLAASRMVPYKRMDLIVESFTHMPDKRLVVIGDGPDLQKVKSKAGKNVELIGYQSFEILKDFMQRAKAFIFAAEEDFGIIAVEAQACGTPVIAYGRGGVRETVVPMRNARCGVQSGEEWTPTGVFFDEQSVRSLIDAVQQFEERQDSFDYSLIRKNAERFSRERFKREFKDFVDAKLMAHSS